MIFLLSESMAGLAHFHSAAGLPLQSVDPARYISVQHVNFSIHKFVWENLEALEMIEKIISEKAW